MKKTHVCVFINLLLILGLLIPASPTLSQDEPSFSSWSIWLGGHYTGLNDFYKKVGEFDRGEEGILPEVLLNYSTYRGEKNLWFSGHYYDSKRMSLDLSGRSKGI